MDQHIEKNVVLLGAGNAHLGFVRMMRMRRLRGVAVTLVSEAPVIPYSAMVPGHIAGDYPRNEITIDLVRLCRSANVRFIAERVTGIDAGLQRVRFAQRPDMSFDALSLGLGSLPAVPGGVSESPRHWFIRPLGRLIDRLSQLADDLTRSPRSFHLVVVGGGVSGCELSLAIRKRLRSHANLRLTLVQGNNRLTPGFPDRVARILGELLHGRDVSIRLSSRVSAADERSVTINGAERIDCDAVLWATNAAPPAVLRDSGLAVNAGGFLLVRDTLQSHSHASVFGTGDCISIATFPDLVKNGVYAVRQGGVLFENIQRYLREQPLEPFRPQRRCLCLINAADETAVLSYGPIALKSRLARAFKDRIDRAWVAKFTKFESMPAMPGAEEPSAMRCGGCGSKISGDVLSAVLRRLEVPEDPRILMGTKAGEDASVHRMRPELFGREPEKLVEVQTVDYFKSFVDDPYLFGQVAAIHAVSDLYAMNARPFSALAIATLPYARGPVQEAMLFELLSGALKAFREAGVTLTGGHTTEGPELALGFAVTGHGEEGRLFRKGALKPGDVLILTKPIGSGALLAAWMRHECPAAWFASLTTGLLKTNAHASLILARHGVEACTDITGFGLAGHLLEMLDASGAAARLDPAAIPLYSGFTEIVGHGIVSTLHRDNAKVSCRVTGSHASEAWLYDPQTSGGLLAGVTPGHVAQVLHELREAGYAESAVIGTVVPGSPSLAVNGAKESEI